MFLTVIDPFGGRDSRAIDNNGMSLQALLRGNADNVEACLINGKLPADWQRYVPRQGDRVELALKSGDPGTIVGLIVMAVSMVISIVTAPKPQKPKQGNRQEAFGIAGYNNTTAPGTPRFVPYGLNRVWGHVISSGVRLSPDGKNTFGRVLYCMGDTGGDEVGSISQVQINETPVERYDGVRVVTRLGGDHQAVIPEFENVDNVYSVGQQLEMNTPVVHTTRSNTVDRVTLFFHFPAGLYRVNGRGATRSGSIAIKIEFIKTGDPDWTAADGSQVNYVETDTSALFKTFEINFPGPGEYSIRVEKTAENRVGDEPFFGEVFLYNVQETQFTTRNYGGNALLALLDLNAKQIQSFESMVTSALMEGKRVKVPDGFGGHVLMYTRQRCWIVRDMMTHTKVGMGYEIADDEIDDPQWIESQDYYDELVTGHDGDETRDLCDFVMNDSLWDWEWVKRVAGEGRGRLIPAGPKWHYVIDRPGTPDLLYTEGKGGNIIEDSIVAEIAPPDRDFHQVVAEFRNAELDYKADVSPPINDPDIDTYPSIVQEQIKYDTITRESQVDRENMIVLKRAKLERRRWTWTSPISALPALPLDLDYFAERVLGDEGAYSGFLPRPGTPTTAILPEAAVIEDGYDYAIIVQHNEQFVTPRAEQRNVATPPGEWIEIEVENAFVHATRERDIFALGRLNIDHLITRCQEIDLDNEGRIRQLRTEYIPAVYTPDPLPPRQDRRHFVLAFLPPLPLRDAQVQEEIVVNRDGSQRSNLIFDVTPGLPRHAGIAQGGGADFITLAAGEPDRDEYFTDAIVRIVANTGAGQERKILAFEGASRDAAVAAWTTAPDNTSEYEIEWERFGEFLGFRVEVSDNELTGFSDAGAAFGTHFERDGREQAGTRYFRFTPFGFNQIENRVARITRAITLTGDLVAPAAPHTVAVSSQAKHVSVEVLLARPVAEDLAGIEIELYLTTIGGTLVRAVRVGTPQDSSESGFLTIKPTITLDTRNYGDVIIARARTVDFSNNASAWVAAPVGTTLTRLLTDDISDNAVSTITEGVNAGPTPHTVIAGPTELAAFTIATHGGSVLLLAQATITNTDISSGLMTLEIRRGAGSDGAFIKKHIAESDNYTAMFYGKDSQPSGTYTYKLWVTGGLTVDGTDNSILAFEVKK